MQASSKIRRFACNFNLGRVRSAAHFAHDDWARCYANAHCELLIQSRALACIEFADLSQNIQSSIDRPFRIVFVGGRIAEISQYPIADVARDKAAEALNGPVTGAPVGREKSSEILWIYAA